MMSEQTSVLVGLLGMAGLVFVWSAISPHDYFTWFLEILPILFALPVLVLTYQRFPFTRLVYVLITLHAIVLMIGGHYTYAEVPLFNWLRDALDLNRNYYDRVGHFMQGFVPAMIAREIFIRKNIVTRPTWLFFIVCCVCLSISACYEFFEWWVAVATGEAAEAFLGTQGDVWDTQWDMLLALLGAILAQCCLSKRHTAQLQYLLKSQHHI